MDKVIVAILNYNGLQHFKQYVPDVVKYTPPSLARIVVIDNASTDTSLDWLAEHYPSISILRLSKNYGFAGGYNEGLKSLQASYFVLLSSDVRVSEGWLEPMLRLMEEHPHIATCQPKVLSDIDATRFDYAGAAGGWMDFFGVPFAKGRVMNTIEKDTRQYDELPTSVFWTAGCSLMVRSDLYRRVHGMYPYLFAHQEEIDMCWRLSLLGYANFVCPKSVVYHLGGGTLSYDNPFKIYLNLRNNLIILYKNLPKRTFFRVIALRFFIDQAFAFAELLKCNWRKTWTIYKAYCAFFRWAFSSKKDVRYIPQRKGFPTQGLYKGSIVWAYYLKGKRTFSALNTNKKGEEK